MEIQHASVRTQRRRLDETVGCGDAFGGPERLPCPATRHSINRNRARVHAAVDTLGHLLALHVTPADEQERAQVEQLAQASLAPF